MDILFDPVKNKRNHAKHGVWLAAATDFEWATAVVWPDIRYDYGEPRMLALGYVGLRLYCLAYVDRTEGRRIISMRKANQREVKLYAET